jgi:hypothetical protein
VGVDEWLSLDKFKLSEEEKQMLPLPFKNNDDLLSTSQVANWILKATGDKNLSVFNFWPLTFIL